MSLNRYGRGRGLALLVPFRDDRAVGRLKNWQWLRRFWEYELPCAQIVIGTDDDEPFSKTCAVDNGFKLIDPSVDVVAMIDADCYISPEVVLHCVDRIREERCWGQNCWFVPYRHFYRLSKDATERLVASDPTKPIQFEIPHNSSDVGPSGSEHIGHRFGALIQIWPKEAFLLVGGMDPRFRGWGGEDVTFVRVLDTLYCRGLRTQNEVLTLWHPTNGDVFLRKWDGQPGTGINDKLSIRYRETRRDPARMKKIISEWLNDPEFFRYWQDPLPPWFEPPVCSP